MFRYAVCLVLLFNLVSGSFLTAQNPKILLEEPLKKGKASWALISIPLDKDSYTYWLNPGETGFAPDISWDLHKGIEVKQVLWESPQKFEALGQVSYGYEGVFSFLAELYAYEDIEEDLGSVTIDYLVCEKELCLPSQKTLLFESLPKQESQRDFKVKREKFYKARHALPQKSEEIKIEAQSRDAVKLSIPSTWEFKEALFIPKSSRVALLNKPVYIEKKAERTYLTYFFKPLAELEPLEGVLLLDSAHKKKSFTIEAMQTPIVTPSTSVGSFVLLFAFLGGLLLNVMPCVLPVVSLKILSFVEIAEHKKERLLRYGILFTLGILTSFWSLALVSILLKHYGEQLGWGFHLQEPWFVASLILIFLGMGLSLFGVFEFGFFFTRLESYRFLKRGGGVFLSGVFTTLVATPCTGPFLGPIFAFALSLESYITVALLTSVGLGLASPYFLLTLFPSLLRSLPKPGAWMLSFRQFLGFLMLGSAAWLLWVLVAQIPSSEAGLLQILLALIVISSALWLWEKSKKVAHRARSVMQIFVAIVLFVACFSYYRTVVEDKQQQSVWENYSPPAVQRSLEKGQAVFIDYTAKWCLICQANRVVLNSDLVQEAFKNKNVAQFKADWTKKDFEITQALQEYGRSGVPLYVLLEKGKEPYIFSQILSQNEILKKVESLNVH